MFDLKIEKLFSAGNQEEGESGGYTPNIKFNNQDTSLESSG